MVSADLPTLPQGSVRQTVASLYRRSRIGRLGRDLFEGDCNIAGVVAASLASLSLPGVFPDAKDPSSRVRPEGALAFLRPSRWPERPAISPLSRTPTPPKKSLRMSS